VSGLVGTALGVLGLTALGWAAYRRGRRAGERVLPTTVLAELSEHKLTCLGEPPERVALELKLLFGTERVAITPGRDAARS
jgi:hypothetical protein